MRLLPDHLAPGLRLLVVGTAVGDCAADRGHHHAGAGDDFYRLLHASGLTPTLLAPCDDAGLPSLGVGLANVVRTPAGGALFDVPPLLDAVARLAPGWVALHGKVAATAVARQLGCRPPGLGCVPWTVSGRPAFVLPSSSGANRRRDYDGRPTRLDWWAELAHLVDEDGGEPSAGRMASP